MKEKIVTVRNRAGIHARPASLIAQTANKFQSEILIERNDTTVNAKSIMGVLALARSKTAPLILQTEAECPELMEALAPFAA